jgi:hypothetical protein
MVDLEAFLVPCLQECAASILFPRLIFLECKAAFLDIYSLALKNIELTLLFESGFIQDNDNCNYL